MRTDFDLDIISLKEDGLEKVGELWRRLSRGPRDVGSAYYQPQAEAYGLKGKILCRHPLESQLAWHDLCRAVGQRKP